jgi:hypothetical protein
MEKSKGHTDWVAVFPIIDTSGELSYKCDKRIDPMELFVDETKTNTSGQQSLAIWGTEKEAMPDLVLPIGKKKDDCSDWQSHPYAEFVIKPTKISKYPGLLLRIKKAMAHHPDVGNSHSDCMARLNAISELKEIINKRCSVLKAPTTKRKRVRFEIVPTDTNKKPKTQTLPSKDNQMPREGKYKPAKESTIHSNESNKQAGQDNFCLALGGWQRSGISELMDLKVTYRTYPTKLQLEGTSLPNGCFGYTDSRSFDTVKNIRVFAAKVPASNLIHSILSSQNKQIPRVTTMSLSRKRKSRKIGSGNNILINFDTDDKVGSEGKKMFRVRCDAIPAIGLDGCYLQDMIAQSLGGLKGKGKEDGTMRSSWYFPSANLAMDHFTLCVLCVMGDTNYYTRLKTDIIKKHSSPPTLEKAQDIVVAGFEMEEGSEKNSPSGVVGYFIMANKSPSTQEHNTELVLAIPSRRHSRLRASGPVTRKLLGKGDVTHFFRLL